MAATYAEEQRWPDAQEIVTERLEDYLATSGNALGGSVSVLTPNLGNSPRATSTLSTAA